MVSLKPLRTLLRLGFFGALVGVLCGLSSALFLHLLERVTQLQETHPWLLYVLPLAGGLLGAVYTRFGQSVAGGNNLLLEKIHTPGEIETVPFRLAPMVLLATLWTHLFGGSAGREGTAVQMGGTLASLLVRLLKLSATEHKLLLMSGISGGFGAVFGTPLAGTVFGLEVLEIGAMRYGGLIPCFVAAVVGDLVCRALGVSHTVYLCGIIPKLTPIVWCCVVALGVLAAGMASLFTVLTEFVGKTFKWLFPQYIYLRTVFGGAVVVILALLFGREYLGLSLPLIHQAFLPSGVPLVAFLLKLLFTAVTLGSGFKGGEVTPLFAIGATLGAALAIITHQPISFFAALGFVAVFAGAANTPLACAILGVELFGSALGVPLLAVCIISYTLSRHRGIYHAQPIAISKEGLVE